MNGKLERELCKFGRSNGYLTMAIDGEGGPRFVREGYMGPIKVTDNSHLNRIVEGIFSNTANWSRGWSASGEHETYSVWRVISDHNFNNPASEPYGAADKKKNRKKNNNTTNNRVQSGSITKKPKTSGPHRSTELASRPAPK